MWPQESILWSPRKPATFWDVSTSHPISAFSTSLIISLETDVMDCMVVPQKLWLCPDPQPVEVTLFGARVFADVITLKMSRWGHPGIGGSPKSNDRCLYKRKVEEDLSHRHRDEGHVKTEEETGVNAVPTRGTLGATRSWKRQVRILLWSLQRDCRSCQPLDFWTSFSKTVSEDISVVLSH